MKYIYFLIFVTLFLRCSLHEITVRKPSQEKQTGAIYIFKKDTVYVYKDKVFIGENSNEPIKENTESRTTNIGKDFKNSIFNEFTPPDRINLWIVIYKGEVYTHLLKKFNSYPGGLRVNSHFKENGKKVIILESKFNPEYKWQSILTDTRDGEYYISGVLLH
jgi:hypothetical protein